ncbi:MAG: YhcH/YjgK/YiaL family protein [Bacteroidales bacterium]|jgi:YhcH/YjgK/YiaL family protein|nr:YhcH/YjgK/YiaL family protein [Bacteroidales bacterium]MCI2121267.1 YhcH/YjgK/YiaL family protein [Bacteroidales bacterium]MCI2146137.1 YhcH/YjgK/YiaL family protein [Bacteroidales bacterium]
MILCDIGHTDRIECLHPLFKRLFDYVRSHDMLDAPLGRIELEGDRLFINNNSVAGMKRTEQNIEAHRKYIDVHILLKGNETIGWSPAGKVPGWKPFDVEKDCMLSDAPAESYVCVNPGDIVIFYPEDAHAPNISRGNLRKLVAKVML